MIFKDYINYTIFPETNQGEYKHNFASYDFASFKKITSINVKCVKPPDYIKLHLKNSVEI